MSAISLYPRFSDDHFVSLLRKFINDEKPELVRFYPEDDVKLRIAAAKGGAMLDGLKAMGCSHEMAARFISLTLYDLVVLIDDSDTMMMYDWPGGERRANLGKVLVEVTKIYTLARSDGIVSVRFFNNREGRKNVTPQKGDILSDITCTGLTMIGTQLRKKILEPFVYNMAGNPEDMGSKPVLVMVITDGDIEGEPKTYLHKVIYNCISKLQNDKKGQHAVAFYFARIGNDDGAKTLIEGLDNDTLLGPWIDCFPVNSRLEEVNDDNKRWRTLQKLLLGALIRELDDNDKGDLDFTDDNHGYDDDEGIGLESPNLNKSKNEFWDRE